MNYIETTDENLRYRPLWWHKQGLSQTATGYGSKLTSSKEVYFEGRWRRVYITCWSNSGTAWVLVKGVKYIVH